MIKSLDDRQFMVAVVVHFDVNLVTDLFFSSPWCYCIAQILLCWKDLCHLSDAKCVWFCIKQRKWSPLCKEKCSDGYAVSLFPVAPLDLAVSWMLCLCWRTQERKWKDIYIFFFFNISRFTTLHLFIFKMKVEINR